MEHITKIPACLLCISGEVIFENELGQEKKLITGDYVLIEPMIKHHIDAIEDSLLILLK